MTLTVANITPQFSPQSAGEFGDARANFPWWSHNFQRIADKDAEERHLFIWNPIQWKLNTIVETNRNVFGGGRYIILKARQMGMSTWITARSAWRVDTQQNYRALHTAHDTDGTGNMLDMIQLAHESLPDEPFSLADGSWVTAKPPEKAKNRNELRVRHNDEATRESYARIKTAGEKGKVGRSASLNLLHISEAGNAVYDDGTVYGASKQGLSKAGEVFVEGTADGAFGWYYNAWLKAREEYRIWQGNPIGPYMGFVPIFFPWYEMPSYTIPLVAGEVIEPQSELEHRLMAGESTMDGYQVSPAQIKWMRFTMSDMPEALEMTPEQWFQQEYASNDNDCFLMSGSSYFVGEYIDKMAKFATDYEKNNVIRRYSLLGDAWTEDPYGPLRLIEEPIPGATYVIGGDAAKGLETGDYDTATIIKRVMDGPDVVVGYWRTHELDKGLHAYALAQMGYWHNKALIAVENNPMGHGNSVNSHLAAMNYPNIYIQRFDDDGKFRGGVAPEWGFNTSHKSKGIYLGDMQSSLRHWSRSKKAPDGIEIPFTAIVGEMRSFQKVDGKTEAAKGSHDDLVISTSIANHLGKEVAPTFRNKPVLDQPRVSGLTLAQIIECSAGKKALRDFEGLISRA